MPSSDARKEKRLFAEIKALPQCILNIVADYNPPGLMEHQKKMKLIIKNIDVFADMIMEAQQYYPDRFPEFGNMKPSMFF